MKLANLSPSNFKNLVPSWLCDTYNLMSSLDRLLSDAYLQDKKLRPARWDKKINFWVDADIDSGSLQIKVPGEEETDRLLCGKLIIDSGHHTVVLPLNAIFKGSAELRDKHCVYSHSILTETPMSYVGITKQRWFDRWGQHKRAAEAGSNFIFHSALRQHAECRINHTVLMCELPYEAAMSFEEEFVNELSLYPIGLNMIPGGFAGLRYLHKLGISARTAAERDAELETLSSSASVNGQPNPLCAARWISDQDFINRVICGHSGRLTVEQVKKIRVMHAIGRSEAFIADNVGATTNKVRSVVSGKYYGKVQ